MDTTGETGQPHVLVQVGVDCPESSFAEKNLRILGLKLNFVRQEYAFVAKTSHILSDFSKSDGNRTRKAV